MSRKCGAKARSNKHESCKRSAMENGRCHFHGGKSTGSKTEIGKLKQKMASWKHGLYSKEALEERRFFRKMLKENKKYLNSILIEHQ